MSDEHLCEACGQHPVAAIACSVLGAASFGYCDDCLNTGREPWCTVLTALWICGPIDGLDHQLALHGKTLEEAMHEVAVLDETYMRSNADA